ncbi:putative TonB-dependent receptor BfrD [compost metagenome]
MQNQIKSPAGLSQKQLLASAIGLAIASQAGIVLAADAANAQQKNGQLELGNISVKGERAEDSYKPDKPASPKYTEPLRDIPQTITVVPKKVIEDQNLMSLRDILSTVPGITFGAGEGGGGYGDSINLRGFSANNDIAVDGLRDSAQYSRTDSFNLEQVEVVNGASSVYSGAGSVGGTINLVSKTPKAENFTRLSAGVGTDSYKRVTADVNQELSEGTAVRVNLMAHGNDAPGRDYEDYERWGIAPSLAFGLGTPTRLTLSYFHQEDNNTPQYGIPFYRGGTLPGVDLENYYGYHNMDEQNIDVDMFTVKLEHDFNEMFSLSNITRYSETDQKAVVNPPQGTWCLANGLQPTGAACGAGNLPGTFRPSGPRGTTRETTNTYLVNQTDLTSNFSTGFIDHTLVTGVAISKETYDLDSGNSQRNADGTTPTYPLMDINNPNSHYTGPQSYFRTGHTDGDLDNRAIYAFDTLKFNEQWELNGGLRYERNEGSQKVKTYNTTGTAITAVSEGDNDDDLVSYRVGLVYKPAENGSVYVAYGNSRTPSKASVNGTCTVAGANNNCNVDPEKAESIEIGTKWDVLDERLSLTAAVFRNDRTNYRVPSGDPLLPEQVLDGQARVDGISLGVAGLITDHWSVFANYTYLDSEVLQSVSDAVAVDPMEGNPLPFTPKQALNVWTTVDLPHGFQAGYGITSQSSQQVDSFSANQDIKVSGYTIHRAMLAYKVSRELSLQLNVNNLFDKEYFSRVRGGTNGTTGAVGVGWATPGDARSATLTANYAF